MQIKDAIRLREGSEVYDILYRRYIVKNYYLKYYDGKLVDVYLDIENDFGDRYNNIEYKYLFYSVDEFSDPENAFAEWVKKNYWSGTKNLFTMRHEQLHERLSCFIAGYYSGYEYQKRLQPTQI